MMNLRILGFAAAASLAGLLLTSPAGAEDLNTLLTQGPPKTTVPPPDPSHVPMVFGKDIKWGGEVGEHQAPLFGDPSKPGIYGVLIKWDPGHNSKPHFHSTDRYAYVISGTWWVSSSSTYDPSTMYPIPAGSFVENVANTVHWDGAKASTGPCMLMLVGTGPMTSQSVPQPDSGAPK